MSPTHDQIPILESDDVVRVRNAVRVIAERLSFRKIDVTKLVTAASEIARNTLVHGGGGTADVEYVRENGRAGVRLVFRDQGPGISDLELAMQPGYTSGKGMGLGLSGARNLVDLFEIESTVGAGTCVRLTKWG